MKNVKNSHSFIVFHQSLTVEKFLNDAVFSLFDCLRCLNIKLNLMSDCINEFQWKCKYNENASKQTTSVWFLQLQINGALVLRPSESFHAGARCSFSFLCQFYISEDQLMIKKKWAKRSSFIFQLMFISVSEEVQFSFSSSSLLKKKENQN